MTAPTGRDAPDRNATSGSDRDPATTTGRSRYRLASPFAVNPIDPQAMQNLGVLLIPVVTRAVYTDRRQIKRRGPLLP
jgi:hypothetical protein